MDLIVRFIQKVRSCALRRALLFRVNGCVAYVSAVQGVFRESMRSGRLGRPRLWLWDGG